jgi:hypothetical protein
MLGLTGLGVAALADLGSFGAVPSQPASNTFIITQAADHYAAYERAARGFFFFNAGVQGPNVAAPPQVASILITRQEPPWHPGSSFWAGIQGPNVRPPVSDTLIIRQQQPWHPSSFLWAGRQQAGNVGPPSTGKIVLVTTQQQPWHPSSFMLSAPPPVPKQVPDQQAVIIQQQQPWHPSSLFFAGTFPMDYEDIQVLIIF